MEREAILKSLREFVIEQTGLEDASVLQDDTALFDSGLLDSMMAVSVVAHCETAFECELDMAELTHENFKSLNTLTDLVCRTLKAKAKV